VKFEEEDKLLNESKNINFRIFVYYINKKIII